MAPLGQERSCHVKASHSDSGGSPAHCLSHTKTEEASKQAPYGIGRRGSIASPLSIIPRAVMVLHFLFWQNYWERGEGHQCQCSGIPPAPGCARLGRAEGWSGNLWDQSPTQERWMEPSFQIWLPGPKIKSWMAAADRDLLLSTYIRESIYCNLQVNSCYGKGDNGSF